MLARIRFRDVFAVLLAGALVAMLAKEIATETAIVLLTLVVQFYFRRKEAQ